VRVIICHRRVFHAFFVILYRKCFEFADTLTEILNAKFMVQCEEISDESFRNVSQIEDEEAKRAMVCRIISI
jgi:hypothetical protein